MTKKEFKNIDPALRYISQPENKTPSVSTETQKDTISAEDLEVVKARKRAKSTKELRQAKILLLIKQSTKERIQEEAWKQHKSTNDLINSILEAYIGKNGEDK